MAAMEMSHSHDYMSGDRRLMRNERRTFAVVAATSVMMAVEITAGVMTGSMALLADGWHMATHAGALAISLMAYRMARSHSLGRKLSFGAGKVIPLGGYTSALLLAMAAFFMAWQSAQRLLHPVEIRYGEAILVAIAGLIVNVVCALLLMDSHHHDHHAEHDGDDHGHHHNHHDHHEMRARHSDQNIRGAFLHVVADALTSVFAIAALSAGMFLGYAWLDPALGIVGSLVILRWAYLLCRDTAYELLDGHARGVSSADVTRELEALGLGVDDLHLWRIAPDALACAVSVRSGTSEDAARCRHVLEEHFGIRHVTIECRTA